jgi:hypothetical protein
VRALVFLAAVAGSARADAPSVGAAIGAGAQGDATYGALELHLDGAWPGVRVGLGARGVWDDGVFRRSEWASAADAVTIVRDVELEYGDFALAAGRLAPARVGHVVDGYRAVLDDRWRTGVRTRVVTERVDASAEIDDVIDPALIAAGARWQFAPPWAAHVAVAADPGVATALETGVARRFEGEGTRLDTGAAMIAELGLGLSAVAFADAAADRGGVRWTARADARAGTGAVGSLFGPLYRVERFTLPARAKHGELSGAGAGVAVGAAASAGWIEVGARQRPGLGPLVVASAGAPMGRAVQAAAWLAAGRDAAAGAGEVRVAWAKRLYSALAIARMYREVGVMTTPAWSIVAWFGATSE